MKGNSNDRYRKILTKSDQNIKTQIQANAFNKFLTKLICILNRDSLKSLQKSRNMPLDIVQRKIKSTYKRDMQICNIRKENAHQLENSCGKGIHNNIDPPQGQKVLENTEKKRRNSDKK